MPLDTLKFMIEDEPAPRTRIRVIGVGGGGANAVARMLQEGIAGVDFMALNTDVQSLAASPVPNKLAIGEKVTHGLGAGSDPAIGRQAALEDTERIIDLLEGADMVFVAAGMGGGTGTGAAPVVASLARELGALTVAVVTKPFAFEGPARRQQAEHGVAELAAVADAVITIPNDQLLALVPEGTSFLDAFRAADDVLFQAVEGISDIIMAPGLINRDFSDVRALMTGAGFAMMGTATATGSDACVRAASQAVHSALMESAGVRGARAALINITASRQVSLHQVNEACGLIRKACANDDVQINFGVVLDESMGDAVKVTVIATGFARESAPRFQTRSHAAAAVSAVEAEPADDEEGVPQEIEQEEEPLMAMAAAASTPAALPVMPPPDPLLDDLDVPAIMRRDRRRIQ